MDLETENRLASLLLKEARKLQLEADREANRVVEINEMWRARDRELELESKTRRDNYRRDYRGDKRRNDSRSQSSSPRVEQESTSYNSSYLDQEGTLGDDEIEMFLHSRVKRGQGAIGSRMDETGPYLNASSSSQDIGPCPNIRVEEKWELRVQGPERPLSLRSQSSADCWHRKIMDGEPSISEQYKKKGKGKDNNSEKRHKEERRKKNEKNKPKHQHHHHHHKSRRRE
uniref:Uncharacterized protein n=1 Tax=Oryza brachyantha TaxID=4533 RepID=J3MR21_ORYBR